MRELAGRRLARYAARVELELGDGSLRLPFPDGAFDRFVAAYVLDLLSPDEIELALHEAHRLLEPGGLLCLVSLTPGRTALARLVTRIWEALWSLHSTLVGGCRPIELAPRLDSRSWSLCHDAVVARLAVSSEVLVAEKRG
jgi:ubiquinone/menaquinone biosynthesis C-methylase UbiE